jgi:alpha-galactosidase
VAWFYSALTPSLAGKASTQAVMLFNRTGEAAQMDVRWADLGIYSLVALRDLWAHQDLETFPGQYDVHVPAHGVVMLWVDPQPK